MHLTEIILIISVIMLTSGIYLGFGLSYAMIANGLYTGFIAFTMAIKRAG